MADLYEELGVAKDASAEDIKRSYRKRAQQAHPDKGGSDEEMARVNRAYLVLSDAETRARYDETGSTDRATGPTLEQRAAMELEALFSQALDGDSGIVNLVEWMLRTIKMHRAKLQAAADKAKRDVARLERKRGKVKRKTDGVNLAERLIDRRVQGLNDQVQQIEEALQVSERVEQMLADYEDTEVDPLTSAQDRWNARSSMIREDLLRGWVTGSSAP